MTYAIEAEAWKVARSATLVRRLRWERRYRDAWDQLLDWPERVLLAAGTTRGRLAVALAEDTVQEGLD